MISIIITSYKEERTISRAIKAFQSQNFKNCEIIVVAPDEKTLKQAKKHNAKTLKDPGQGKPTALNLTIKKAKGNILILTDGDVYVSDNSVKDLIKHFKDKEVGAVSSRPVILRTKSKMFDFWAYLTTQTKKKKRLNHIKFCSEYIYAIRKNLYKNIPKNILADDAFISLMISNQNKKIIYEPKAEVYVKYPSNLRDWIRQKKRTAGKYYQLNKYFKQKKSTEFLSEVKYGLTSLFYIKNFQHLAYFIFLIIMRLYIWFRVFFDIKLWKREFKKTWLRPVSTKN